MGTNDDIECAVDIGALPFSTSQDTTRATTVPDDPNVSCGSSRHSRSVWYRIATASTFKVRVTTEGSNYDTVIAVWKNDAGNLKQVGCNNNSNGTSQSSLIFDASAGLSYYVEVMAAGAVGAGGDLQLFAVPSCNKQDVTVYGVEGDEVLTGTSAADVILAFGGNDEVHGGGGADLICGGDGNDSLFGEDGNDKLFGDGGNDRLLGGPGTDKCSGGGGTNTKSGCES